LIFVDVIWLAMKEIDLQRKGGTDYYYNLMYSLWASYSMSVVVTGICRSCYDIFSS